MNQTCFALRDLVIVTCNRGPCDCAEEKYTKIIFVKAIILIPYLLWQV